MRDSIEFRKIAIRDIVYLTVYVIVGLIAIRKLAIRPGTLGLRHDWPIPGSTSQLNSYVWQSFGVWLSNVGKPNVYPSLNYFKLVEQFLLVFTGPNPVIYSKVLTTILIAAIGIGFYVYTRFLDIDRMAGFIGGIYFMTSPLVFNQLVAGHLLYLFSMALAPVVLTILVWGLKSGQGKLAMILAGMVYGIAWAQIQFAFLIPGIVLVFLPGLYWKELDGGTMYKTKAFFSHFIGFQFIGALLHSYWLYPFIKRFRKSFSIGELSSLSYHSIVNGPSTAEALFGLGYPHQYAYSYILTNSDAALIYAALIVVLIIGMLSLFFREHLAVSIASGVLMVIGVILLSGIHGPIPDLWRLLFVNVPFLQVFREVYHFAFLPIFATATLFTCGVHGILERFWRSPHRIVLIVVFFLLIGTAGGPVLSGNFNGQVQTYQYPSGTVDALSEMENDERNYRVLYLPGLNPISFQSARFPGVDPTIQYSPKPTFPTIVSPKNSFSRYLLYTIRNIRQHRSEGLSHRLGILSTERVIWRRTAHSVYPRYVPGITDEEWSNGFEGLASNTSEFEKTSENGDIITLRTTKSRPFVHATGSYVLAYGQQDTLRHASSIYGPPVVLMPSPHIDEDQVIKNAGEIFTDDSLLPLFISGQSARVVTFSPTGSNPANGWATLDSTSWWDSSVYWDIPNQYRDDFVQTSVMWDQSNINSSIAPTIAFWTFNHHELRSWRMATPREQFNVSQTLTAEHQYLSSSIHESTQGWKTVRSPPVNISANGLYNIGLEVRGNGSRDVHVKIQEFGENGTPLDSTLIANLGDSFEWSSISKVYSPTHSRTRKIQVQVWYINNSTKSTSTTIDLDNVRIRNLTPVANRISTETEFSISKRGDYLVFGQIHSSEDGGAMTIEVDNKKFNVSTDARKEAIEWTPIGTTHLASGNHHVRLINRHGHNGLSQIVFISRQEYLNRSKWLESVLNDTDVRFRFKPENAFDRSGEVVDSQQGNSVRIENSGTLKKRVTLPRSGRYQLSINGSGPIEIHFDNWSIKKNLDGKTVVTPPRSSAGQVDLELRVAPHTLESFTFDDSENVSQPAGQYEMGQIESGENNDKVLEVTTESNESNWSRISTETVDVIPQTRITVSSKLKFSNVRKSHVSLVGYNINKGKWEQLVQIPSGRTGSIDWQSYRTNLVIPSNITKLKFIINAGWVNKPTFGNATTWIDELRLSKSMNAKINLVRISSVPEIDEEERNATIVKYEKLSPTKYQVRVRSNGNYTLTLGEAYNQHWVAQVEGPNRVRVQHFPTYSATNGFRIAQSGLHTVIIEFQPNSDAKIGWWISILSIIGAGITILCIRRRTLEYTFNNLLPNSGKLFNRWK